MTKPFLLAVAAAVSILVACPESRASSFCSVASTSDGFAALRAEPNTRAAVLARLRAGDEVMLDPVVAPRGRWVRVSWWRGTERVDNARHAARGQGWLHDSLLERDSCG